MDKPTCSIDGCLKPARLAGMCSMHHTRKLRHGDPHHYGNRIIGDDVRRFWSHVEKTDTCWIWKANVDRLGYGKVGMVVSGVKQRVWLAHRISYQWSFGPIPVGKEIDHLCRNRSCVRPDHLEAVTHKVNMERGRPGGKNKTHCPQGHPYAGENLYVKPNGSRVCRTCQVERRPLHNAKRRAQRQAQRELLGGG